MSSYDVTYSFFYCFALVLPIHCFVVKLIFGE